MRGGEARGLLHPFLLLLIWERPGHGYDLIERLDRLGVPEVEPGHVYRVLRGLERARLVESAWVASGTGPPRRRYELTPSGLADLEECMERLDRLDRLLDACKARWAAVRSREGGAAPGVRARRSLAAGGSPRPYVPS